MRRSFLKKIISFVIAVSLCVLSPLEGVLRDMTGNCPEVIAASNGLPENIVEIDIYTADDLIELAENCHHEAWSSDKFVVLQNDISLEGTAFTSIPIFAGIFNGNGYTISGYSYEGTGYVTGFFRYITESGTVQGLTIEADINAAGDGYVTGVIAGINDGYVRKCTVNGRVHGITATGGVIGINGPDGLVLDCENNAQISGFYYTGGIAGRNYGIIRRGINSGNINSTSEWAAENDERQVDVISEITGDLSLISYQSGLDAGGIAGFSAGMILSSRNDALVGYERVGYNIGGICGRQCGTLYSCTNNGKVQGKKDVGGIVGQQEPYIETDPSKSVSEQIARINALVNMTADDAEGATPAMIDALTLLQQASGHAVDDITSMTGDLSVYRIEERDWAGIIEERAENAEREAAASLEARMQGALDGLPREGILSIDDLTLEDITLEDLENIIERLEDFSLSDAERELLQERERLLREAEEAEENVRADAEAVRHEADEARHEAENQFNDTVNEGIGRWNSGIDSITENKNTLTSDLGSIRYAADNLMNMGYGYSTQLSNDLSALNEQINKTYDLVEDLINGVTEEGVDYLFSDVSETGNQDVVTGRTVSCRNNGSVYGDINAGGIAGSLSVDTENLESNAIARFELKAGEAYAMSSTLDSCQNHGIVNVRTDAGGGIAGRIEHGCIKGGCGYGAVISEEGDHIGGIAGYSEGTIVSSYSTCTLSGRDTVGGIAGYAVSIKQCIAMPVFGEVRGGRGGIAGQILRDPQTESIDGEDFTDNHYVSGDYYGIDDISYDTKAAEISYDELMDMEGIPSEFERLKVIFVSNGEIIKIYPASYDDDMGDLILPDIPDVDGSYGVWPDLTGMKVSGNMVVEAEYVSHVQVLRSDSEYEDTGKPLALVQGQFKEADSIRTEITDMDFAPSDSSAYTDVTIMNVSFDHPGTDFSEGNVRLRLYAPYEECRIWKKTGDVWYEVPCEMIGTYAQIPVSDSEAVYAVTKTPDETLKYAGYAIIIVLVLIFAIVMIRQAVQVFKKSRKKSGKTK